MTNILYSTNHWEIGSEGSGLYVRVMFILKLNHNNNCNVCLKGIGCNCLLMYRYDCTVKITQLCMYSYDSTVMIV